MPLPIPSREHLVSVLKSHGLSHGLCLWMTTNIKMVEGGYTWRFNIPIVEHLFESFLQTDYYNFLEFPPHGTQVNIVRGKKYQIFLYIYVYFCRRLLYDI